MIIGVPKEVKDREFRVGMVPAGVQELKDAGHRVLVETTAGAGSGFIDDDYRAAGAEMLEDKARLFREAEMVVKVKEPIPEEFTFLRPGLVLFTYLHLAADLALTRELMQKEVTSIAYETIEDPHGHLPLLIPMSEVAGRLSAIIGAELLRKDGGGPGILLGGVPGVRHGRVTIIGGGTVGLNAAKVALGLGAEVVIIDRSQERLAYLDDVFHTTLETLMSNRYNVEEAALQCDLLIGGVLVTGEAAPKLVSEEVVKRMRPGSVIVDVAIDQGGCIETIHPTTHSHPTYVKHGVIHYGVTNMPGLVPRTSTLALTNVTLPYVLRIANLGLDEAMRRDLGLKKGCNVVGGKLVQPGVAAAHKLPLAALP